MENVMEEVLAVDLAVALCLDQLKASLFEPLQEEDWGVNTASVMKELRIVRNMGDATSLVAHTDKTSTNGMVKWCGHHLIVGGTPTPLQMKVQQRCQPRCCVGQCHGPRAPNPQVHILCGR
jgi:hypothetical protein